MYRLAITAQIIFLLNLDLREDLFVDLLVDGLRAFKKGSPNMNSLVGFGSIAAFTISAVRPRVNTVIFVSLTL